MLKRKILKVLPLGPIEDTQCPPTNPPVPFSYLCFATVPGMAILPAQTEKRSSEGFYWFAFLDMLFISTSSHIRYVVK